MENNQTKKNPAEGFVRISRAEFIKNQIPWDYKGSESAANAPSSPAPVRMSALSKVLLVALRWSMGRNKWVAVGDGLLYSHNSVACKRIFCLPRFIVAHGENVGWYRNRNI